MKKTFKKHYSFSLFFRFRFSVFSAFSVFFFSVFFFTFFSSGSGETNSSGLRFLGGDFIGDFFSGVGCPFWSFWSFGSFLEDLSCFGDSSFSGVVHFDWADLSEVFELVSCFFFDLEAFSSSPGMPRISAHWSGGGVGCFLSSSVSPDFCGANGVRRFSFLSLFSLIISLHYVNQGRI